MKKSRRIKKAKKTDLKKAAGPLISRGETPKAKKKDETIKEPFRFTEQAHPDYFSA